MSITFNKCIQIQHGETSTPGDVLLPVSYVQSPQSWAQCQVNTKHSINVLFVLITCVGFILHDTDKIYGGGCIVLHGVLSKPGFWYYEANASF